MIPLPEGPLGGSLVRVQLCSILIAALWAPTLAAQQVFTDPDFGITMQIPSGMRQATAEELARLLRVSPEEAANVPRAEADGQPVHHSYVWLDETTPYNRQISIALGDGEPPFKTPKQLTEAQTIAGLTLEKEEIMPPPVNALRMEGTFLREPDQVPMRRLILYAPDFAGQRFGIVTMQAFAGDWPIVIGEFDAAIQSLRFVRTTPPPTAPTAATGRTDAPASPVDSGDWGSLEVLGSLALAAVLLGSLMLGGRSG
jgi:hypothetical protein